MPVMSVSRAIDINTSLENVTPLLREFKHWPNWSPWTCQEPEVTLNYHGEAGSVGSSYDWDGKRIGSGNLALLSATDERIECDLNFIKPFKSHATTSFDLERLDDNSCRVHWNMDSSLPFFMFFMRKSFETYIGMDYDRGLRMLKELAETGEVKSQIDINNITALPDTHFVGLQRKSTMAEMIDAMPKTYTALYAALEKQGVEIAGPAYCHYMAMDPVKDHWVYTMAVPVASQVSVDGFISGKRTQHARCAHLRHTGHYVHLGNAWATSFSWMKAEKLKMDKKLGAYEVYIDNPQDTASDALRTDLYIPIK